VLLWWKADRRRLSATARRHLDEAPELLVSPLTFWEVAMLVSKQRIALDRPTATWTHDVLAEGRVTLAPITAEIAVAAGELGQFPGDPVDRVLAATAEVAGVPILTKDARIREHAKGRTLRAVW
ncbi:MAG TPA: type II toxin-antitoxin system VapC family toxin, partial [Streptomyces sp.]|nr:type II toxin-antitoxin system VapC family toxin [Streptomyces sp.]